MGIKNSSRGRRALVGVAGGLALGTTLLGVPSATADLPQELTGPRGIATVGHKLVVADAEGNISRVNRRTGETELLTTVPSEGIAPAIAGDRKGRLHILTPGGEGAGAATLYRYSFRSDRTVEVKDIARYQHRDVDPFNQESAPEESNPFGVAAVGDGTVLVSDAAGNDLLRVWPSGRTRTVARLKPRVVESPDMGEEGPPPGTPMKAEAVATSVAVGNDGYWYVGELRGFPATPGTSQVWRIAPGSMDAVCNPNKPRKGDCKRFADGFTSIVGLAAGSKRSILVVELAKESWLAAESGGSTEGSLFRLARNGDRKEKLAGQLNLPGGAVRDHKGRVYVTDWSVGHFFEQPGRIVRAR